MTLNLTVPQQVHISPNPRISVIGVGGGGTNSINTMIDLGLNGVEFIVANTDAQQLSYSKAEKRVQLGPHITQGNGAGGRPEIGKASAEEAADEIMRHLEGINMVFITAGMGGGTGTGAAPVIARMAREQGILTVGVVTKPFSFEGSKRAKAAEDGIKELQKHVDTLIVIPNQNLFKVITERTSLEDSFRMVNNVLYMGVRSISDLMLVPGLINLDFADVRSIMGEMGKAMMGTGEAEGENRAVRAAEEAINNPLLEDTDVSTAKGLIINVTGGPDLTMYELDQAVNRIREEADPDAYVVVGSALDPNLEGVVRISVVSAGIDQKEVASAEEKTPVSPVMPVAQAVGSDIIPGPYTASVGRQGNVEAGQAPFTLVGSEIGQDTYNKSTQVEASRVSAGTGTAAQISDSQVRPVAAVSASVTGGLAPSRNEAVAGGTIFRRVTDGFRSVRPAPAAVNQMTGQSSARMTVSEDVAEISVARESLKVENPAPPAPETSVRRSAPGEIDGFEIPAFLRR